jgi:hypothetical protein
MDMAGNNDNRKSLAEASERMQTGAEKRVLNRKLQRERRLKERAEHEATTMTIDSMFARQNAANGNINEK